MPLDDPTLFANDPTESAPPPVEPECDAAPTCVPQGRAESDSSLRGDTPSSASEGAERGRPVAEIESHEIGNGEEPPSIGLGHSDRLFLIVVGSLILSLLAVQAYRRSSTGMETIEIDRLESQQSAFRIEINEATWVEWMQLEGIGEVLARRIVQDREDRGPFPSIEDVRRVSGIGPKTMDNIRQHLECRDCQ